MASQIVVPCPRTDLFAFYGDGIRTLPVVGWDANGRALVQKPEGSTVLATRARLGAERFRCVGTHREVDR